MKKISLLNLFLIFTKIGAILLGGGYVILPILMSEFVEKREPVEVGADLMAGSLIKMPEVLLREQADILPEERILLSYAHIVLPVSEWVRR
jgi:hypothetical protein